MLGRECVLVYGGPRMVVIGEDVNEYGEDVLDCETDLGMVTARPDELVFEDTDKDRYERLIDG